MLVDISGDGDVSAGRVTFDIQTIDGLATPSTCFCGSPNVQAVETRTHLDVVAWVCAEEFRSYLIRLTVDEAVVKVDATDAVPENEPEPYAGR